MSTWFQDLMSGNFLGSLVGGAANLGGAYMRNEAAAEQANLSAQFQGEQSQMNRVYNAYEAGKAREFNAEEAAKARAFGQQSANTAMAFEREQAGIARQFSSEEAGHQRAWSEREAAKARDFTAQQNWQVRDWTEKMSNTAYQRATADMKAAGINPMVAYMQGGASTPSAPGGSASAPGGASASAPGAPGGKVASGATASGGGAQAGSLAGRPMPMIENIMSGALATALEAFRVKPQVDLMRQQEQTERAETQRRQEAVKTQEWTTERERTEARKNIILTDAQERHLKAEAQLKEYGASQAKEDSEFYASKVGAAARYVGNLGRESSTVTNSAENLARAFRNFKGWW